MTKDEIKLAASADPYVQARLDRGDPAHLPGDFNARILRPPEVFRLVGLNQSTVFRLRKQGKFPRPIRLGKNSIGWVESEVVDWLASRPRLHY